MRVTRYERKMAYIDSLFRSETEGRCIPNCGNTLLDNGEECDTTVPSDKTCITEMGDGYTGTLSCTSTCTIDTGNCTKTSVPPPVGDWDYIQTYIATYSDEQGNRLAAAIIRMIDKDYVINFIKDLLDNDGFFA